MTREERHRRWQEIFDEYDRALGEAQQTERTLSEQLAPLLNQFIAHADETRVRVERIARAVHKANRAALALYRE